MKANVRDMLVYLFRHYRHAEFTDAGNHPVIRAELAGAGYSDDEIRHALMLVLMPARARLARPLAVGAAARVH